jgi:hypothetical protein
MEIRNTATYDPTVNAHIVYLLPENSKPIADAASKNKGKGTLLLSEAVNGCKTGATINFLIIENKVKFEYSKGNAVKLGMKTNDDFKALAHKNLD